MFIIFFQNLPEMLVKESPVRRLLFDKAGRVIFYKILQAATLR